MITLTDDEKELLTDMIEWAEEHYNESEWMDILIHLTQKLEQLL
jgi:hypothetical protein